MTQAQMTDYLAAKLGISKRQAKSTLAELNALVSRQLKKEGYGPHPWNMWYEAYASFTWYDVKEMAPKAVDGIKNAADGVAGNLYR